MSHGKILKTDYDETFIAFKRLCVELSLGYFLHQVVICAQSFIKQPNVLGALFKSFHYMVKISHRLLPCGELTFDMQPAYKDIISHGLCLFL